MSFKDYIDIPVDGIVFVGANVGQEMGELKTITKNIVCFEPIKSVYDVLNQNNPDVKCYNFALGDKNETKVIYNASNNYESSSFLIPANHSSFYPSIIFTQGDELPIKRYDELALDHEKYNVLISDTQGYELNVLKGFGNKLYNIDIVIVEYINSELYQGDSSLEELEKYLKPYGLKLHTVINETNGSGDAVFKRYFIDIIADGGLGNRMNSVMGGMILSKKFNKMPVIHWEPNNWCGCNFNDLFETSISNDEKSIVEVYNTYSKSVFYIHVNQLDIQVNTIPILNTDDNIKTINENVVYYNSLIPNYINESELLDSLSSLNIKEEIRHKVNVFCEEKQIDSNCIGIHLRMTDFNNNIQINDILSMVSNNSSRKYFICSDSKETEDIFKHLNNVIIYEKKYYVDKLNPHGGWNDGIIDNNGRVFNFNVKRTKNSVIESFIDLLILSRTRIEINSESTFLKLATLYSKIPL